MDHMELSVQVPKPIMEFIEAYLAFCGIKESAEEYLRHELEWHVLVHVKNNLIDYLEDGETVLKTYGLKKLLKEVPSEDVEI